MMKQQEVFNKIGGIIKEINDQYQYLETIKGHLNDLELELFVANTHFLADHAEVLRKINIQNAPATPVDEKPVAEKPTTETPPSHEEIFFEPVIQTGNSLPKDEPKPEIIRHELEVDENWQDDEPIVDEGENTDHEEVFFEDDTTVVNEHKPIIDEPVEEVNKIVEPIIPASKAEVDEVYTINQKISAQMGKTEPVLLPITDLKSAITLNDKLLFVKDLFNGYSLAYSEAIEILNRFTGLEEADTFLKKNYATKNNWESKPQTAEKFYELLKRRYA
ncbi:MAG: hypothetical protein EOP47_09275 [Sphingobacteriaceae bacterium]|nr:MAG: hypothetical protein EOP47_09275 [Sphingobacteriaceae bacterium]